MLENEKSVAMGRAPAPSTMFCRTGTLLSRRSPVPMPYVLARDFAPFRRAALASPRRGSGWRK